MVEENTHPQPLNFLCPLMVSYIKYLVPTHLNKMDQLRENIDILLKPQSQYSHMPLFQLLISLMQFKQQLFSLTFFPLLFFNSTHLGLGYIILLIYPNSKPLIVLVSLISSLTNLTNQTIEPKSMSFWVIHLSLKGICVQILGPIMCILLDIYFSMSLIFPSILFPRAPLHLQVLSIQTMYGFLIYSIFIFPIKILFLVLLLLPQSIPVSTHSTYSSPSSDIPQSSPTVPIAPNPIPHVSISSMSKFSTIVPHTTILIASSTNQHPMTTRPKSGITKPKLCYKVTLNYTYTQPPTYKIASTYPKWWATMDAKISDLKKMKNLDFGSRPS